MQLTQAILARRSIRGFQSTPVPQQVLKDVLSLAVRAVSASNTQPWSFSVVTGGVLDAIRGENVADFQAGRPTDYADPPVEGVYQARARAIGAQIFTAMEIGRADWPRRTEWAARGFRFFDAPAVILLSMDAALDETAYRFNLGCVTQNICLAALEYGLGTCVQNQAIYYQGAIRKHLQLPADQRLVCGIAIGYPDWDFPANHVISTRVPAEELTRWYGYETET